MSKFITIRNLPGNISFNNGLAKHLFHIFLVTQVSVLSLLTPRELFHGYLGIQQRSRYRGGSKEDE